MFVLTYSEGKEISPDNHLRAFNTYEEAHEAMEAHVESVAQKNDYSIENRKLVQPGLYDLYGSWCGEGNVFLGLVSMFEAFLEDGDHWWAINEIPNTVAVEEVQMFKPPYKEPLDIRTKKAREAWESLKDVPFDEDEDGWLCLHEDTAVKNLNGGHEYPAGVEREQIWMDIEECLGVSVAWLMGEAKNPDGTNE